MYAGELINQNLLELIEWGRSRQLVEKLIDACYPQLSHGRLSSYISRGRDWSSCGLGIKCGYKILLLQIMQAYLIS